MRQFSATCEIPFPTVSTYLETIRESFSAHNMVLTPSRDGYNILSTLGTAHLWAGPATLSLSIQSEDPAAFTRLKHELTGLLDFVCRPEHLSIVWHGDSTGALLPADLRVLAVRTVDLITPNLRRITFTGSDLARYARPDQLHCRLLFQPPGTRHPHWPTLDDNGRILWPQSGKLSSRIFTIRHIDTQAGTLTIDFVIHPGGGPGMTWASQASAGDIVGILGPAAYGPKQADWTLLAGDETGLPGIARIVEDLPDLARGYALIEVGSDADEQRIDAPPGVQVLWLHRGTAPAGTTSLLIDAVRTLTFPTDLGSAFAWVGTEYAAFRALRAFLRDEVGFSPDRMIAFSHWRRGMSEEDIVKAGIASVSA